MAEAPNVVLITRSQPSHDGHRDLNLKLKANVNELDCYKSKERTTIIAM